MASYRLVTDGMQTVQTIDLNTGLLKEIRVPLVRQMVTDTNAVRALAAPAS